MTAAAALFHLFRWPRRLLKQLQRSRFDPICTNAPPLNGRKIELKLNARRKLQDLPKMRRRSKTSFTFLEMVDFPIMFQAQQQSTLCVVPFGHRFIMSLCRQKCKLLVPQCKISAFWIGQNRKTNSIEVSRSTLLNLLS